MATPSEKNRQKEDLICLFQDAFHRSDIHIHLNNAGIAPISRPARDALHHWSARLHHEGSHAIAELFDVQEPTRERLGRLIGAPASGIAFFSGASIAISQLAFGLDLKPGDEILTWDQEYPSNFYPWRDAAARSGAKLVMCASSGGLSTPVERLLAMVTPRTRIIAFSWVQFQTGAITEIAPLTAFARERGILTFADGIQGLGLLPFHFETSGLDAIVGGSHKWLAAPLGVGFLCAKKDVFENLRPLAVGAMTYGTPDDPVSMRATSKAGPARFEPGSRPMLELAAFGAAVDLTLSTGIERIAAHAESLAKRLAQGLEQLGYEIQSPHATQEGGWRGAIVNAKPVPGGGSRFSVLGDMARALQSAGVSFATRAGGIRFSPHAFNTQDQIDRVLATLG